ncbi:MAG: hypothetical protein H7A37_03080 [Chlamydiales bacterium]|nr:hypothetical protein [Chlamydiales bacterium]
MRLIHTQECRSDKGDPYLVMFYRPAQQPKKIYAVIAEIWGKAYHKMLVLPGNQLPLSQRDNIALCDVSIAQQDDYFKRLKMKELEIKIIFSANVKQSIFVSIIEKQTDHTNQLIADCCTIL